MDTDLADLVDGVPGRFVPEAMSGQLVEAEHLTRYWWAGAFVRGRRVLDAGSGTGYGSALLRAAGATQVTGIDVAEDVVAAAGAAAPDGVRFEVGDVRNLAYPDDSFDVVTCFEVIEHIAEQADALAEIARVLAPGGILLVSSPNRDVYTPGNPHHVRELLPQELEDMLAVHWPHTRLVQQHNFLASAILSRDGDKPGGGRALDGVSVRALVEKQPGEEVYVLGVASTDPLPEADQLIALASAVEIRGWVERFQEQQAVLHDLSARVDAAHRADEDRRAALARLAEAEQMAAEVPTLRAAAETAGTALAAADEELLRLRGERDSLAERLARADRVLAEVKSSPSWRVTAPLRAFKRLLRR
jgi:SAM-dependent methyltransferase